jgi:hypothetical protein
MANEFKLTRSPVIKGGYSLANYLIVINLHFTSNGV